MAGTITHSWNGTILTITSDSGTSSADLKGSVGDIGPRGPQGPAGITISADGTAQLEGYATEAWVEDRISQVQAGDVNLDNYYTKAETLALIPDTSGFATTEYVDNAIAGVEGGGGSGDLANYYTKAETNAAIDQAITANQPDLTKYYTKSEVDTLIANAEIGGGDGPTIDLSLYALKTDIPDVSNFITMSDVEAKGYQTAAQVQAAINEALAALDGDEVTY